MKENLEYMNNVDLLETGKEKKNKIDLCMSDENKEIKNKEDIKNSKSGNRINLKKKKHFLKEGNKNDPCDNRANMKCELSELRNHATGAKNKNDSKMKGDETKEEKQKGGGNSNSGNSTFSIGNISSNGSNSINSSGSNGVGANDNDKVSNGNRNGKRRSAYNGKDARKKKEANKENTKDNSKKAVSEKKGGTSGNSRESAKEKSNTRKKNEKDFNGNEGSHRSNSKIGENKSFNGMSNENSTKKKKSAEQKNKANSKKGAKKAKNKSESFLQNSWTFSFEKENRKFYEKYVSSLVSLETFNTIEKFYKNYKYMKSPSAIREYYNIYLFKQGFRPLYEEYPNGFICIIKNPSSFRNNVADLIWEKMVLSAIGEEFNISELTGIQLCIRENEIFFKIWIKNYSNYLKNALTKRLSELLELPPNVSIIIKILSNVYYNRKYLTVKDKNDKGKKVYNKNKTIEYPSSPKRDFFKMKNYGNIVNSPYYNMGSYNFYKNSLDMNLYYLYNSQSIPNNPYFYYPMNMYSHHYNNNYPEYIYDYNMHYPIEPTNYSLDNEIHVENKFVNTHSNGIIFGEKKNKFDYIPRNKEYKKNYLYTNSYGEIFGDSKSSTRM
ncbi:hypothetical protein POVCU1_001830 [Plasmodium ovale curtisi]|uniref:Eukaryotic translation initiation factor 4E n=1 Tax=Plasmodium ovale curtisi TaxID=864141 RepID=A0A1A8VJC4_PLAOA|nr:hypothetical protein POVCU1_001830 [Plasmodium ovale curtisi]